MTPFHLQIVTPDQMFFDGSVEMVIVRTQSGDLGVMKGHANYVASLEIGQMKVKRDGKTELATLAGGFIQIDKEKTIIVTEAAEWARDIDVERARKAEEGARRQLQSKLSQEQAKLAEVRLKKALNRIRLQERA